MVHCLKFYKSVIITWGIRKEDREKGFEIVGFFFQGGQDCIVTFHNLRQIQFLFPKSTVCFKDQFCQKLCMHCDKPLDRQGQPSEICA